MFNIGDRVRCVVATRYFHTNRSDPKWVYYDGEGWPTEKLPRSRCDILKVFKQEEVEVKGERGEILSAANQHFLIRLDDGSELLFRSSELERLSPLEQLAEI